MHGFRLGWTGVSNTGVLKSTPASILYDALSNENIWIGPESPFCTKATKN
jgi:hypothetical protein